MPDSRTICSWSGGKDSCLACYRAIEAGFRIDYLLRFISREYKRCCFHGIDAGLARVQAQVMGIPLVQKEVSADMKEYEHIFKTAVSELKGDGVNSMIFGDIYLDEHKQWVERVCAEVTVTPFEPLWGISAEDIADSFIDLGFKAIVVSCDERVLGKEFIGRTIDHNVIDELKRKNICPCGENGEFHTFVVDGPLFKNRIEIAQSTTVLKEGFWNHWFLDIQKYHIIKKNETVGA